MSYAEIVLAIVPDAPPTRKNQRATSCPAPISANVPYLWGSRLIWRAFWSVLNVSRFMRRECFSQMAQRFEQNAGGEPRQEGLSAGERKHGTVHRALPDDLLAP